MEERVDETLVLPPVYYDWLATVRRYPMFDVWRGGTLCSMRLVHILVPERASPWDIFAHWQQMKEWFPTGWLPLAYDSFGNAVLWDMNKQGVYVHWRGYRPELSVRVAETLESFLEKLYYRPIY